MHSLLSRGPVSAAVHEAPEVLGQLEDVVPIVREVYPAEVRQPAVVRNLQRFHDNCREGTEHEIRESILVSGRSEVGLHVCPANPARATIAMIERTHVGFLWSLSPVALCAFIKIRESSLCHAPHILLLLPLSSRKNMVDNLETKPLETGLCKIALSPLQKATRGARDDNISSLVFARSCAPTRRLTRSRK